MKCDSVKGRICRTGQRAPKATPKPHQCDIKATSMRVDSQAIGTPKPPQSYFNATLMRPQSYPKAPTKPPSCDPQAVPGWAKSEIRRSKTEGNPKPEVRKKLFPMGMPPSGGAPGSDSGFWAFVGYAAWPCFGRVTVNSEPWSTWLETVALPLWASTTALTRLRPRPRPRWERLLSPR